MHGTISVVPPSGAISASAVFSRQRQFSAEPLWFAVMCRHLWGTNATKELQFISGRSERTCRAWASGDSLPQSDTMLTLVFDPRGRDVLDYVMENRASDWWLALMRAERIVGAEDQIDRS